MKCALLALLLASLSGPAVAQDGRDSDRRAGRENWSHHHKRGPVYEPRAAPRVGEPDPYAPKVGAPNPYAPRVGEPNPYATRAGDPPRQLQQGAPEPERRNHRR